MEPIHRLRGMPRRCSFKIELDFPQPLARVEFPPEEEFAHLQERTKGL